MTPLHMDRDGEDDSTTWIGMGRMTTPHDIPIGIGTMTEPNG
jgi:hypothetical protein